MDQFEAAKQRALKNRERFQKYREEKVELVEAGGCAPPIVVVHEEKEEKEPSSAAVIEVKVTLPTGEFSMTFVKPAVFQNASPSRLTPREFANRIIEGLKPLLGDVRVL